MREEKTLATGGMSVAADSGAPLPEASEGYFMAMEPPLARTFRSLADSGKYATVNSLDGSTVKGKIIDVDEDGTVVRVENQDIYVFDIAAVVMVKIER